MSNNSDSGEKKNVRIKTKHFHYLLHRLELIKKSNVFIKPLCITISDIYCRSNL